MATLVFSAVGNEIGGPLGAQIGAYLGQQVDRELFSPAKNSGARLKELAVTTSSYGQPLSRLFGTMRIGGSIIWSTDLFETGPSSGSGKNQPSTSSYSYSASFAVALSSTPIEGIGRIWADGNLLRGAAGDLKVGGLLRIYRGHGDQTIDPIIEADQGPSAPAFRDSAYVVFEDLQLAEFGNRIPALSFEVFGASSSAVSLLDVAPKSISPKEHGLLQHSLGFADDGGPISNALATIDRAYPICCRTTGFGLEVFKSDTISTNPLDLSQTILANHDGLSEEGSESFRVKSTSKAPNALRYYDEARDYQPGIQRAIGSRAAGMETVIDLPAAMTADGARDIANVNANRSRWRAENRVWTVRELDPALGPGAVVRLPDINGLWLVKEWEWNSLGVGLKLERVAPGLLQSPAGDSGAAATPADDIIGSTSLAVFELPSFSSEVVQKTSLFAAASSENSSWKGASLFLESGTGLVGIGNTGSRRAVLGTTTTELPQSNCAVFEPNATLSVELVGSDQFLTSSSLEQIAQGTNKALVANEIIQFARAHHLGGQNWRIEGLLRGRGGTEDMASSVKSVGASFVLLDDRLTSLDPELVPSAPNTRVAAIGLADQQPVFADIQNPGLTLKPLAPVHARWRYLLDGSLSVSWVRRARGQWRWSDDVDLPLVEERENYQVGFGPTNAPLTQWQTTLPELLIASSDIAAISAEFPEGAFWVRQVGTYATSSPTLICHLP